MSSRMKLRAWKFRTPSQQVVRPGLREQVVEREAVRFRLHEPVASGARGSAHACDVGEGIWCRKCSRVRATPCSGASGRAALAHVRSRALAALISRCLRLALLLVGGPCSPSSRPPTGRPARVVSIRSAASRASCARASTRAWSAWSGRCCAPAVARRRRRGGRWWLYVIVRCAAHRLDMDRRARTGRSMRSSPSGAARWAFCSCSVRWTFGFLRFALLVRVLIVVAAATRPSRWVSLVVWRHGLDAAPASRPRAIARRDRHHTDRGILRARDRRVAGRESVLLAGIA